MTVIVTGGAGFIGSAVVRHVLRTTDERVVNVDKLTYAASPQAVEEAQTSGRYLLVEADVSDRQHLTELLNEHQPSGVIHLAAETHVDRSIDDPQSFIRSNVVGTASVADASTEYWQGLPRHKADAFRLLVVSTDEVFGDLAPSDSSFDEDSPYSPNSPYAASKAAGDMLARAWSRTYGVPLIVTHCSNNYGPWQFPDKLVPVVITNAIASEPIPLYGSGENVRNWIHVEDHADALWTVFQKGVVGHRYLIGGDVEVTNRELVQTLCSLVDDIYPPASPSRRLIKQVDDRPGHDHRYSVDSSKVREALGWSPKWTISAGLSATIKWYVDNRAWWEQIRETKYDGSRLGTIGRPR